MDAYAKGPVDERRDLIVSDLSGAINEIRWIADAGCSELPAFEDVF